MASLRIAPRQCTSAKGSVGFWAEAPSWHWADACALRRQVEEQLQEAEKLAEGAAQRRRQAEAQAAALQVELEAARVRQYTRSDRDGGGESATAFQLRMLQDLVQKQEDEVREARRLKSHVRCAPGPGRRLSQSEGVLGAALTCP